MASAGIPTLPKKPRTSGATLVLPIAAGLAATIFYLTRSFPQTSPHPPSVHALPRARAPLPEQSSFCARALKDPKPYDNCKREENLSFCKDGHATLFSNSMQDYYVYTKHFIHLNRPGVYLDIAANDPVYGSNTFFLDVCLRWSGMCVEANPEYHPRLRKYRGCVLLPTCISNQDGEKVSFILHGVFGGITDTNKHIGGRWDEKEAQTLKHVNLTCTTMRRALDKRGVTKVDFLSLDVEGHELKVLQGFDWDNVVISVMVIETSETTLPGIQKFMESRGYVRHTPDLK